MSLLIVGLLLILAGLTGWRILTIYPKVAIIFLNTLLLFLVLEFVSSMIISIVTLPVTKGFLAQITGKPNDFVAHHYLTLPYYTEQDWASGYWQEHRLALKKTYYPYVLWRSPPFTGETLNIDQDGIRQTPGAECVPEAYKVFILGGSAMWGWGAPDWGTIPAYLQAELQAIHAEPVCVVNLAENAYVSTQSLIQLQLELGKGNVPDAVIFYDGVNEVLAANQTGQPILHQNFREIATRFENAQPLFSRWFQNLNSFQLFQMFLSQIGVHRDTNNTHFTFDSDHLVNAIVQAYLCNLKSVSALAETYQFDYYFFWQPYILIGNKPLTSEEQRMLTSLSWVLDMNPVLINLFKTTYERIEIEALNSEHLYSLAYAFDEVKTQLWIDTWGHVTPVGNRQIAQKILAIIERQLVEE